MKKIVLWSMLFVFAAGAALAQGSGMPKGGGTEFIPTKDIKGVIRELDVEKRTMIVESSTDKQRYLFSLDSRIKLKADKKTDLARSKKKIELADFAKEQVVRVSYKVDQPQNAIELRLLEPPPASAPASGGTR